MRPANIITAISDILAGASIAVSLTGAEQNLHWQGLTLLIISTIGLYGGGVVLNDVFDADLDLVERPERAIPSGIVSKRTAAWWGVALLIIGLAAAAEVHTSGWFSSSAMLAIAIALFAVVYDKWAKHHNWLGPLNMGICRGLNLLLGMSILEITLQRYALLSIVPVFYIASITMISRGEVHGGNLKNLYVAGMLYLLVMTSISVMGAKNQQLGFTAIFMVFFAILIFPPLIKAIRNAEGALIGKAVKSGVIALIVMNAGWAAAFGMFYFAWIILLLLPVSLILAKLFAVT